MIAAIFCLLVIKFWLYLVLPTLSLIFIPAIIIFSIIIVGETEPYRAQSVAQGHATEKWYSLKPNSSLCTTKSLLLTLGSIPAFLSTKYFISLRYHGKHYPCMASFNSHFILRRYRFAFPFYRWGSWGTKKLIHRPKLSNNYFKSSDSFVYESLIMLIWFHFVQPSLNKHSG